MSYRNRKKSIWYQLAVMGAVILLGIGSFSVKTYAASGTVYTCTVNQCYAHPVTGVIEDSGGEASYATGQGMAESCIYSNGILEVTDDGEYYLTLRMSMMDYTSDLNFEVQNVGDSGWQTPAMGVTGNGTDGNGSTADVCMQVPSENCVVRVSMYVTAMERSVIYYAYPSDYVEGNNTDMNATMVTEASGYDENEQEAESGTSQIEYETEETETSGQASGTASASLPSTTSKTTGSSSSTGTGSTTAETSKSKASELKSSISENTKETGNTVEGENSSLNSAEGLSLSTMGEVDTEEQAVTGAGNKIFQISLAVVISGLIFIGTITAIVYFFRRNWKRWGGAEDDEE